MELAAIAVTGIVSAVAGIGIARAAIESITKSMRAAVVRARRVETLARRG